MTHNPAEALRKIADEIFERWDKDQRSGKLLTALAGRLPGYRADVDAVLAALSPAPAGGEAMLKPCPFCGGQPTSKWYGASGEDDDSGYWGIECSGRDCRHAFAHEDSEAEAVAAWNKRAPVTPPPASGDVAGVVERLRKKRIRVHDFGGVGFEVDPDCDEAATLLESLSAEKGRMEAAIADWIDEHWSNRPGGLARGEYLKIGSPQIEARKIIARTALTPKEKA